MSTDELVRGVLREHGLRNTGPRLAILRLLADPPVFDAGRAHDHRHAHLSVAEIHDRLSDDGTQLDVTTVYRTLTTLAELGVVHALEQANGASTYGLAASAHHHAVCRRCGLVIGVPAEELSDALGAIERVTGFGASEATVTLHGLCAQCRDEGHARH